MPDETAVSAPGGGAPAGGGGAAPAAPASSAPAAPAPSSTPTASETPSTPTAPAVPAPITRNPGESADEFMARYRAQQKTDAVKTGDEKPPEAEAVKPAEPAKPEATTEKPPEPTKVEAKEEKPAATPETVASKLAETIFSNDKLATALEEAGLKDELAEELRTAGEGRQFSEVFPGGIETARFARQQAEMFTAADLAASNLKIGDVNSTRDFVQNVLMPMSYILKEDGTPETVEIDDGRGGKISVPRTDGTVDVLLSNLGDLYVDRAIHDANHMLQFAEKNPDNPVSELLKEKAENVLAAADILKGHHKNAEPAPDAMTPEMKAERAKLDADKQALAEQKSRESSERFTKFRNDLVVESDKALNTTIEGWLDQTSLAPNPADSQQTKDSKTFLRTSITNEIRNGLYDKLHADPLFMGEQEQKGRRGTAALKDLVSTYTRYANKYIFNVAQPILAKAGHERVRQSQARSTKIAAQQDATRVDARAGSQAAAPKTPVVDERQIMRDVTSDLLKKLGRMPNDDEKVAAWREAMKVAKSKVAAAV